MIHIKDKEFICRECGASFVLRAKTACYCPSCRKKVKSRRQMLYRASKDPNVLVGVGKGGHQLGKDNHSYIDGRTAYRRTYFENNPKSGVCEICGSTRNLVVHHIDKDRTNADPGNLIILCKSCHAQVHGLVANLGEVPMVEREVTYEG